MIVALDTQLTVGTATGAGVYQRDLAAALPAAGVEVRALRAARLDPWRFDRRVLWDQILLPLRAAVAGARLLHATAGTLPFVRTLPTVVTVHDVAWHRVQHHAPAYARFYFGALTARAYRSAARIICDSHFSADELDLLVAPPVPIDVVYPGVDARFGALARRPQDDPFALVVGTVEARKNLLVLVEALPHVPALRLVSVGPFTPYVETVRSRARALGVDDRLDLRGYVARDALDDLYARTTCALIPSRYEGFGYPLAEALCGGVPALAARSSSLVEVADGSVTLVDPDDRDGWVDALRALLGARDEAQRNAERLRAGSVERFSWSSAAVATRVVYERAVSK